MPDFNWKQGDDGPILTDRLTFAGGVAPPVEDTQLTFRIRSLTTAETVPLTGEAKFTSLDGDVMFVPSKADTGNAVGNYMGEWIISNELGQQETFPTDGFLWGRIEPSTLTAPQLMISPMDVKEHLNIPAGDRSRDAKFIGLIQTVTPMIEAVVGPVVPKLYDEWHDGGSRLIELWRRPSVGFGTNPVLQLVGVSEYRGPIEYPLSLIMSPAFGSIYSTMLDPLMGTITRRTAGGRTLAFMPGSESVHVIYRAGQASVPANVIFAAQEAVRVVYEWTRQVGRGSEAPADAQELGPSLEFTLSRMIRGLLAPTRLAPSFA